MARYRKIDTRIWNDEKFREMSDKGKLAFLFMLTHPHMTSLGAMRGTIAGLASEMGWTEKAFREAFGEACKEKMVEHDERASFIALPNFLKYNGPESPNVVKSWADSLDLLPECKLKTVLTDRVRQFVEGLSKGFGEALPEAFRKSMPNQEQEQEPEQEHTPEAYGKACVSGKAKGVHYPEVFDTPDVHTAIEKWGRYYREKKGEPFSAMMQEALLAESLRKRWSPERLVNNIVGSIGKGWQTVNDVDDRIATSSQSKAEQKPAEPHYRTLAPPKRPMQAGKESA